MEKSDYIKKLYFKQWIIGLARGDIREMIRTRNFRQDFKWIQPASSDHFYADPFIIKGTDGEILILFEDFLINEHYGNISLMTLDRELNITNIKVLLDTGSHLSFPFIFREDDRIYIFPESVRSGKLSCYRFDPVLKTLIHLGDIMDANLYDPAILKFEDKYWLFGSVFERRRDYKLHIFVSESITGPYIPHRGNPVRNGLNGTRAAGDFIEVDGNIYRPAQNCAVEYGESITLNRITALDEKRFSEEPYMTIRVNRRNMQENGIHNIHTLNVCDDLIVIDGLKWTFSVKEQWKNFIRNRRLMRQSLAQINPED
ncbi:MAG TPA: hypothetical protein VK155_04595 [Bacteroidales bacterium]|nr:hypothetical protein [Bacteroidales bacterium]